MVLHSNPGTRAIQTPVRRMRRSDLKAGESVDLGDSGILGGNSATDILDGTNSDNDVLDGKLIPMGGSGIIP